MQRIGFVVSPGFQIMSVGAAAVFEFAQLAAGRIIYDVRLLSETGGAVRSSIGVNMETEPLEETAYDTLIVVGGGRHEPTPPGLVRFVHHAIKRSRRVAATCAGAFVLAEAGILDGRRVTTHWLQARDLQARFPKVMLEEDRIFIQDGAIWTSAGMTSGIDLALALIEQDLGSEIALSVARNLLVYHRRAGGQSQFSALLELEPKSDRIQNALGYARNNLHKPLSVAELADAARLSPRQFSRAFRAETGQSPAKAVETLRLEAARLMMEQTRHPVDTVAAQTGFADRERMRRAFLRAFGQTPRAIRRNARSSVALDSEAGPVLKTVWHA